MILECSSKGDKRFSALYARFHHGETIEHVYQHSKRDAKGHFFGPSWRDAKGKNPSFLAIGGDLLSGTYRHDWYRLLWEAYFLQDDCLLLEEASRYDRFSDRFDGSGTVYLPMNFYLHGHGCSQAAAIASLVYEYRTGTPYEYPQDLILATKKIPFLLDIFR